MGVERGKKMLQNATVSFTFPFAIRMYLSISLWDLEHRASARRKLVVIVTRLHVKTWHSCPTEVYQRESKRHSELLQFQQGLMTADAVYEDNEVHPRDSQRQSEVLHFRQTVMTTDEEMMGLVLAIARFAKRLQLLSNFQHIFITCLQR